LQHSEFHKEFFPTPLRLAFELAKEYRGKVRSVLDPSAGKGDLLVPFENYRVARYGIEQSLGLCAILRDKKITVLGHDFLQYSGEHYFDLVVMNPPFSNCADHFLHAWNVCKAREIAAVLPKRITEWGSNKMETIGQIIHDHGEIMDLGQGFMDAERSTKVEVVKVVVRKPDVNMRVFAFDPDVDDEEPLDVDSVVEGGLVKRDMVSTIVDQYGEAVGAIRDLLSDVARVRSAIGMLVPKMQLDDMIRSSIQADTVGESYNQLVDALKTGCWGAVLREGDFARYMTTSCQRDFQRFVEDHQGLAFNEENIASLMTSLVMSNTDIFKQNIIEVFDYLTKYHQENRVHIEGWKTNDRWRVKRKFILPYIVEYRAEWGMSQCFHRRSELHDIDIAMCTITGKNLDDIDGITSVIDRGCKDGWPVDSEFFKIKCYQKGTGHFEFRDEGLWDQFNRIACDGKKWLPGD